MRIREGPSDQAAWGEFVARYQQRIHGWCRRWGLQDADAEDVTQTVLVKLLRAMQTFQYDPSQRFRAWLKTVTHHAWQDFARSRQVAPGAAVTAERPVETLEARDDLADRFEQAYEQELLSQAFVLVSSRVQPKTWQAFRLTALEGASGADAAAQLGMPVTAVYKAKSNVQKLLEQEVRSLDEGGP
jgi:RNA polymerase sigma-70 factor (ECF subfamily)